MNSDAKQQALAKVPEVTLIFWIIKVFATTLGETGGDTLSMSMNLGYLAATGIFLALLAGLVWLQVKSRQFQPSLYWATIIASTTAGTTLADFATRSLGIGYTGGTLLLLAMVIVSLAAWYRSTGTISVASVSNPKSESYYWLTITFSQTLGTALGDWLADDGGLGYMGAALVFGALLAIVAFCYFRTTISRTILFWSAFILTRPLGAAVGDFLDKPLDKGGLGFSRAIATAVLAAVIVGLLVFFKQRPAKVGH